MNILQENNLEINLESRIGQENVGSSGISQEISLEIPQEISQELSTNIPSKNIPSNSLGSSDLLNQSKVGGVTRIEPSLEFKDDVINAVAGSRFKKIKDNIVALGIIFFFNLMLAVFSIYSTQKPEFFPYLTIPVLGLAGTAGYLVHQRKKKAKIVDSSQAPIVQADTVTVDLSLSTTLNCSDEKKQGDPQEGVHVKRSSEVARLRPQASNGQSISS
jgi:hypothetical protein